MYIYGKPNHDNSLGRQISPKRSRRSKERGKSSKEQSKLILFDKRVCIGNFLQIFLKKRWFFCNLGDLIW